MDRQDRNVETKQKPVHQNDSRTYFERLPIDLDTIFRYNNTRLADNLLHCPMYEHRRPNVIRSNQNVLNVYRN